MTTAALSTTAKTWKQPKHASTGEWNSEDVVYKHTHIHTHSHMHNGISLSHKKE